MNIVGLTLILLIYRATAISHDVRLRDLSYAYGVDVSRQNQNQHGYYQKSSLCDSHTHCVLLTQTADAPTAWRMGLRE